MTNPSVIPVTELDLDFFFIRLCPSLNPLYTNFITTIIHHYQLLFLGKDKMSYVTNFWRGIPLVFNLVVVVVVVVM